MNHNDKKQYRQNKRLVKKDGNRKVRRKLKNDLENHPEEAHWDVPDFGYFNSKSLNGIDHDSTRNKHDKKR